MKYDIIGDIHGHADELIKLLMKLDYEKNTSGTFSHPNRKVIFSGDFIDRGNQNIKVLETVMPMVKQGHALAVMGNHEYNAICFHSTHPDNGLHLREHDDKNINQHKTFLAEFEGKDSLLSEVIEWFKTLPLFLDLDGLRVVHAEWNFNFIQDLKQQADTDGLFRLNDDFLLKSSIKGSPEYIIVETILKGSEIELPEGYCFTDKDKNERTEIRVKWWQSSGNTYRDVAMLNEDQIHNIPELPLPDNYLYNYPENEQPVFFGHYWMRPPVAITTRNSACVDFSLAKGGVLCGYRWDGETALLSEKIISVSKSGQ